MTPDPATRAREIVIGCHVRHRGFSREQVERAYAEWSMDACAECIAAALACAGRGPETGPDERLREALEESIRWKPCAKRDVPATPVLDGPDGEPR